MRLRLAGESEWQAIPVTRPYTENSRGLGLAEDFLVHLDTNGIFGGFGHGASFGER